MANLINRTRRTLLQLIGLGGVAGSGALHAGAALAQNQQNIPATLEKFKGPLITRSNKTYLDWCWSMSWYRIKPTRYPAIIAQPTDKMILPCC